MKHKAIIKTNIAFKIKNNFVESITFNILNQYQNRGREVPFNKITYARLNKARGIFVMD